MPSSVASHVRTSRARAGATASLVDDQDCGLSICGLCSKCDPLGFSLRTSLRSEVEAATLFSVAWKMRATPAGRSWLVLETSARRTSDSESSSQQGWPTPTVAEAGKIPNRPNYGQVGLSNHPAIVGPPQRERLTKSRTGVSQWTTPQAQDAKQDSFPPSSRDRDLLSSEVARTIWPTPTASDMKASGSRNTANSNAHPGVSLTDAVNRDDGAGRRDRMKNSMNGKSPAWSTPRSQDEYEREQASYCGRLNHRWVAQLMGFHPQWCDVNPDCDDTP